jgi:negative regulator of replication initiation
LTNAFIYIRKEVNINKETYMRTIRISEEVWQAIADRGKFGETEEDVLRRVFELPTNSKANITQTISDTCSTSKISSGRRRSFATIRMTSYINKNQLNVEFANGASLSWTLPNQSDKKAIRTILDKAITFAKENKASLGQINAIRKTLTDNGYHLTK